MRDRINEIMLIDDDLATNYLSKYIIDDVGCCENLSVHDMAQDALDDLSRRIENNDRLPEVIFLDLNMPRIDGWEFLEIYETLDLSQYSMLPDIYVLSTTMNPQDRLKAESINAVSRFYAKPLTEQILTEVMTHMLQTG